MYKVKEEKNKGITLISLVLSIIVLLILAGVSLSLVVGETGIVERASKTKNVTETAELQEKIKIAAMAAQVEGLGTIPSIDVLKSELDSAIGTDYTIEETENGWTVIANKSAFNIDKNGGTKKTEYFDAEEWDKTAASEDCFYWASDIEGTEGYGTVIGYTAKIENYEVLRYPSRCTNITFSSSNFSNEVTNSQSRSFTNNLLKLDIPGTVESIYLSTDDTFNKVKEIYFEYGVDKVQGISGCSSLKKITIPNSVTNIDIGECLNLTNIEIDENNKNFTCVDGIVYNKDKSELVYWPAKIKFEDVTIPDSITRIRMGAFPSCTELTQIIIPNNVKTLEEEVLGWLENLTKVYIPKSVETIERNCFYGCPESLEIYTDAEESLPGWESAWNSHFAMYPRYYYNVHYNVSLEEFNALD